MPEEKSVLPKKFDRRRHRLHTGKRPPPEPPKGHSLSQPTSTLECGEIVGYMPLRG
jgi:hypothetical protein